MAEVSVARESSASPLNGISGRTNGRNPAVLMNNGFGRSVSLASSSVKGKNEAMRFLSEHLSVRGTGDNSSVDGFIRESNGSYEVKVWNETGQSWNSGRLYGSIVPSINNTGKVLTFKKQRGRWTGTLTERGNYGMPDRVRKVF